MLPSPDDPTSWIQAPSRSKISQRMVVARWYSLKASSEYRFDSMGASPNEEEVRVTVAASALALVSNNEVMPRLNLRTLSFQSF